MPDVGAWGALMTQALTVAPLSGRNVEGAKTYGAAVPYACRLAGKRRQVLDARGQQVVCNQTAWLATADVVDPEGLVTLSTADVGSTESFAIHPPIIAVGRYPDENGNHHSVLFLK